MCLNKYSKLLLCPSTTSWRRIGGVEVKLHSLLIPALYGGEWAALRSSSVTAGRGDFRVIFGEEYGWVGEY
jgi:hypothetical protein